MSIVKKQGANKNDRQQIDSVAREENIDNHKFGKFVHKIKDAEHRGPSENYDYQELRELAKLYKELE
jgi:hypothetical protein